MADKDKIKSEPIVIRKPRRHTRAHGGAWKVAYADFVTAMMALFIVLWILNQDPSVVKAVGSYFKAPGGEITRPGTEFSGNQSKLIAEKPPNETQWRETEKRQLEEMGRHLVDELSKSPEFATLMDQIRIEVVREGLRIEIVESANEVFFEIGSSTLKKSLVSLLGDIGSRLKDLPNKIIVEGHTDSRPYPGILPDFTNFELSAERANSARRALTRGGLRDKQIEEIRGYADSQLRDRNDPFNVVNRRISIIVKYTTSIE